MSCTGGFNNRGYDFFSRYIAIILIKTTCLQNINADNNEPEEDRLLPRLLRGELHVLLQRHQPSKIAMVRRKAIVQKVRSVFPEALAYQADFSQDGKTSSHCKVHASTCICMIVQATFNVQSASSWNTHKADVCSP